MWPGPRPISIPSGILIHAAVWPQRTWAENWKAVPLWERGAGSTFNTMWPGPRPSRMRSFILIRSTIWQQYPNVTDRTDRTDNGLIAQGEPFYKRSPKNSVLKIMKKTKLESGGKTAFRTVCRPQHGMVLRFMGPDLYQCCIFRGAITGSNKSHLLVYVNTRVFNFHLQSRCFSGTVLFGRLFVKRFALCYWTIVCLSCLSVMSCLQRWCIVAKRLDGSR